MPNWVFNKSTIKSSDPRLVDMLEKKLEDAAEFLSFTKIVPPPDGEYDVLAWNTAHWGTKWDACQISRKRVSDTELEYRFDTAWSPPVPVFEKLSETHPTISVVLEYEEEQGFGAILNIAEGETSVVDEWDIPISHEDLYGRKRECYCELWDEPAFPDCFPFRAKLLYPTDTVFLEHLKVLAENWSSGFSELVEVARNI